MAAKVKLPVITFEPKDVDPDDQSPRKGIVCQGCELEGKKRCPGAGAHGEVDIMFVSESPSSWSVSNGQVFYGRGGRIIRQAWKELLEADNKTGGQLRMKHLKKWDTYAVQCQVEEGRDQSAKASATTVKRCANYLRAAVAQKKPKVIIALGATALSSLGFKTEKFTEARGKILHHEIEGHPVLLVPTFGTKQMLGKTGLFNLFYNDLTKAVKLASGVDHLASQVTLEELSKDYIMPKTVAEVKDLCDHIINYVVPEAPVGTSPSKCALAVDTETNTVNPHRADAKVLCISFAWDAGRATAIPLFHPKAPWSPSELDEVLFHVRRVLECPKPKIFHNAGFDLRFLELRHGLRVANVAWDTMLGEHLLREDMSGSYSLKVLGRSYFPQFSNYADKVGELASKLTVEEEGVAAILKDLRKKKITAPGFEDGLSIEMGKAQLEAYLFGEKKHRKKRVDDSGYERVPLDILLPYAAVDTDLTRRLLRNQIARVNQEGCKGAHSLMKSHCIPASRVLGKMEFDGFPVDRPYLDYLEIELTRIVDEKMKILRAAWTATTKFYPDKRDEEFNPNSTQQIAWLLFTGGVMDPDNVTLDPNGQPRPVTRQGPWCEINKSGQFKTDKKTLKAIAEKTKCPFARTLLEFRAAHKALTGFVAEIKVLSAYDGRVHTGFFLHGTSTGRLASRNPNMQNLPAKKIAGINIKKLFIPDDPEEEVIFNVDWKGAEIRVFTAYARDAELEKALNDGLDVHSWFTQEIFGIPYAEVEAHKEGKHKELRTTVKRVVFGILYGAMAKKIAETAGISEERAQEVIDKLFDRFPSLKGYMDEVVAHIHKFGFVETFFGRRRRFPLVRVNGFFRGQAERRGKNMKIQSTSSDIVIGQLIEIFEHIHELGGRLCITVHDSIVGTIKKKYLHLAEAFFQKYCVDRVGEKYPWLPVAFACDVSVGPSYGEVIDLKDYLAKNPTQQMTPEQEFFAELDEEALHELREDEEEAREREQMETALKTA